MAELGSGSGTTYPASLDVDASRETTTTYARADVPNDLAAAIIAVETELGVNPAGSLADVVTRLNVQTNTDGSLKVTGETTGALLTYTGTAWGTLSNGSSGQYLKSNGTGTALSWDTPAGGNGKAVLTLLPGSVKLPNSDFARLGKISSTGVWNILKFLADGSAAADEVAYYQVPVPAFYSGTDLTISIYSKTTENNVAGSVTFTVEVRAIATGEVWDGSYTTIGTATINPASTNTAMLVDTIAWSSGKPTAGDMLSIKCYADRSTGDFSTGTKEIKVLAIKIEED